jgi:cell division protein FtsQ
LTLDQLKFKSILFALSILAIFLASRLCYVILSDPKHFGVEVVKIEGNFLHVSRDTVAKIINKHLLTQSFYTIKTSSLQKELEKNNWVEKAHLKRIWPNALKITIFEKTPYVYWNKNYMTKHGVIFKIDDTKDQFKLPKLYGLKNDAHEVLTVYKKLSIILEKYDLQINILKKRDNQSWDIVLTNQIKLYLGKQDIEKRLLRFCKSYQLVFANRVDEVKKVDLRYPKGMAVSWKIRRENNG